MPGTEAPPGYEVVRVFTDAEGRFGNPLAVYLDGPAIPAGERQAIAAALAYSETVFVDHAPSGALRIFTPREEMRLVGHPLVGVAWLLGEYGIRAPALRPPGGSVPFWREGDMTWIRSSCDGVPPWQRTQAVDAPSVDAMAAPDGDDEARQVWAWLDEPRGLVRARVFASRFGVLEDEACGSASMLLCRELGRPLTIVHGQGSIVAVRPGPDDTVELGGRVMPGA